MAAPAYQASGAVAAHASAAVSPAWPSHQSGDLGLLVVNKEIYYDTWPSLTTPSGFKELIRYYCADGYFLVSVFWCLATSGAMASPTVSANTDARGQGARIHTFRGCDTVNPIITGNCSGGLTGASSTSLAIAANTSASTVPKFITDSLFLALVSTLGSAVTLSSYGGSNLTSITECVDASMTEGSGHVITAVPGADGQNGPLTATLSAATAAVYFPFILQGPTSKTYSRSRVVNQ